MKNFVGICLVLLGASVTGAEERPCKPETWRAAIAAFEKGDATDPPAKGGVVFVGSSSIRGWDLEKSFPELNAINRGFGGSQLCDATHYADRLVLKHQPRAVVVYAGDNDVAAGKSAEQVHRDFRAFVAKIGESLPEATIAYISIKPSIARWKLRDAMQAANQLIAADCEKDKNLHFVDVWSAMLGDDGRPREELFRDDGLHLNEAGYELWADLVRPLLTQEVERK